MAGLNEAGAQLDTSWKILRQRWEETRQVWNDRVRRGFEQDHWDPLAAQVPATQRALEQLAITVAQARRNVK